MKHNDDDYTKRHIDPSEFAQARTWASRWELLHQLSINISLSYEPRLRDDLISEATMHAANQWRKWQPSKGDGFRYFSTVVSNRMKRITRNQHQHERQQQSLDVLLDDRDGERSPEFAPHQRTN